MKEEHTIFSNDRLDGFVQYYAQTYFALHMMLQIAQSSQSTVDLHSIQFPACFFNRVLFTSYEFLNNCVFCIVSYDMDNQIHQSNLSRSFQSPGNFHFSILFMAKQHRLMNQCFSIIILKLFGYFILEDNVSIPRQAVRQISFGADRIYFVLSGYLSEYR